jgi:hypothetical protein
LNSDNTCFIAQFFLYNMYRMIINTDTALEDPLNKV